MSDDDAKDDYDLTDVYDREIAPLVKKLSEISVKHKIPACLVFCPARKGNKVSINVGGFNPSVRKIECVDDILMVARAEKYNRELLHSVLSGHAIGHIEVSKEGLDKLVQEKCSEKVH